MSGSVPAMRTILLTSGLALLLAGCASDPPQCVTRAKDYSYCHGSQRTEIELGTGDPTVLHVEEVADGIIAVCPGDYETGKGGYETEAELGEDCAAMGKVCVETLRTTVGLTAECRDPSD